jgi:hypothetical protein
MGLKMQSQRRNMDKWITSSGVADKRIKEEVEEPIEILEDVEEEESENDEDEGTT